MTGIYKNYKYKYFRTYVGCSPGYFVQVFRKYGKKCLYKFVLGESRNKTAEKTIEAALNDLIG